MITVFSRFLTKYTTASLFHESVVSLSIFAFMCGIARTFKAVNRRALNTIGTTLMLSALLSACGGGGGGSDAPAPAATISPTTPTFSVSSSNLSVDEDFATPRLVASVSNATAITVSQSNTGVVTVTTSNAQVYVSSIPNANGRTILTIRATNGTLIATTQVTVTVDAVNDTTTPTFSVSSSNFSIDEDFATPQLVASVSNATTITVSQSNTGVVTVTTSNAQVNVSSIANANGRTILTIRATNGAFSATTQVTVTVNAVNDPPILAVSSNNISTVGGFSPITINTTASDIEDGALAFTVSESTTGVVRVGTSADAIILSNIPNASGQTTLTVTVVDSSGSTVTQTIAVNVTITTSTSIPALSVSSTFVNEQEDFGIAVVIRTTATDADGDAITLSVSTSSRLVDVAISTPNNSTNTITNSITLSAVANAHGTTTLTVLATDSGGQSHSTEIVVVVTSVEDTPILTVTSNAVTIGSDPVVLTVSAFDVEDSTLSFSVSTGQGVVNTAITTTSLTITRLGLNASQIILTLRTTDTGGLSTFTSIVVSPAPLLVVTTGGIKTLNFAWSAITSATHYQLQSNPDGTSGFTDLSTTGIVVSPNSTNIRQTTAQALVALHRYIPNVRNPQYSVGTCNTASSCAPLFAHNTVSLTNAQLNSLIGRLQASNAGRDDSFGAPMSLSGDGNTLAVGAWNEDGSSTGVNGAQDDNTVSNSGAVYVFRRNGGAWSQQAYIKASNTGQGDYFGFPVSLSSDGNTLAVGAISEAGSSTGVNGVQNDNTASFSGAVYVFRRIGGVWSQQAYIKASNTGQGDFFTFSVSLNDDGNTLAVGAYREDSSSTGVNGAQNNNSTTNSGAVYLFRFNTISSIWSQQAYIKASNTGAFDQFGWSASLSADGNTLAVGATGEDSLSTGVNRAQDDNTASNSGAVYLFRFNTTSSIWSQQAYIKASNMGGEFGNSVSLSADGNTLAVGARDEDSSSTGVNGAQNNNSTNTGAVYVFRFSTGSSTWAQQAYIKASNTGALDQFGNSMSLSADGNILAVGATGEDGSTTGIGGVDDNGTDNAGATYVFEFGNGAWAQQAYIKAIDPSVGAFFGGSVSLSSSGDTLAVGAYGVNNLAGAVYLY